MSFGNVWSPLVPWFLVEIFFFLQKLPVINWIQIWLCFKEENHQLLIEEWISSWQIYQNQKLVTSSDLKNFKVTITFCTISQIALQCVKAIISKMQKYSQIRKPHMKTPVPSNISRQKYTIVSYIKLCISSAFVGKNN